MPPAVVDAARAAALADTLAAAARDVVRETAWALLRHADVVREGLTGERGAALAELGTAPLESPLAGACARYARAAEALQRELRTAHAVLDRALGHDAGAMTLDPLAVSMAGALWPQPVEAAAAAAQDALTAPPEAQAAPAPAAPTGASVADAIAIDDDAPLEPLDLMDPLGGTDLSWLDSSAQLDLSMFDLDKPT